MKQHWQILTILIPIYWLPFLGFGQSTETDFLTFTFSEQTTDATINTADHTIVIEVVNGTDLTTLSPTFTLSSGATSNPESGVSQDFSSDVTYTVTAEDGTTIQQWSIIVTAALSDETNFLTFSLDGIDETTVIDTDDRIISVEVPDGTDQANLIPVFSLSDGASTSDLVSGSSTDFSESFNVDVVAENGTTRAWSIEVSELTAGTAFLSFSFTEQSQSAVIDLTNGNINIEVVRGSDLTNISPDFTLATGATSNPEKNEVFDFSSTVTYQVTARNLISSRDWKVTVSEAANSETDFQTFSIDGSSQTSTINTLDHTIQMDVEAGSDLSYLVPTFTLSNGATADPASGIAQDFTSDVVYTVTAEDGTTTQEWIASISNIPQGYTSTASNPTSGTLIDVSGSSFELSFSEEIPESLLTDANFGITSRLRGAVDFEFSGGGTEKVTLTPTTDLFPGDDITVVIRNNLVTGGQSFRYKTYSSTDASGAISFSNVQERSITFFRVDFFDVVDMDEDGALDFLSMRSSHNGDLIWSRNSGTEGFSFSDSIITVDENYSGDVSTFDFNRDGRPEPVLGKSNGGGGAAMYLYDAADEVWQEYLFPEDDDPVEKLLTADLNNDLRPDFITLKKNEQKLVFFQNRDESTPSFTLETKVVDVGVSDFYLEDLNADGYIDILTKTTSGSIRAYYNDGNPNPSFSSFELLSNTDGRAFTLGFIEQTTKPNLVVSKDNTISIYSLSYDATNDEPGISLFFVVPESTSAYDLVLADVDSDGDLDIVSLENEVFWYEFNTAAEPVFTRNQISLGESTSYTLHVADLDGDSDLDVFTAAGETVRVYESTITPKDETDFHSFSLTGQVFSSTIDSINHTIDIPIPHGTLDSNPAVTFVLSEGATADIESGDVISFEAQVGKTFTVTDSDGVTTQDWVVTVWPDPVAPGDIVAYYPLDGNGHDISGNGNNGTTTGELGEKLDRFGNTYSFPSGAELNYQNSLDLINQNNYTISFWIKVKSMVEGDLIRSPALNTEYEGVAGEIMSKATLANGSTFSTPHVPVQVDLWEHAVISTNGTEFITYRNGVEWERATFDADLLFENGAFVFGQSGSTYELDDLMIFSTALSADEVQSLYSYQADDFYQVVKPILYGIDHPDQTTLENIDFSNRKVKITMPEGTDLTDLSFQVRLIGSPTVVLEGIEQSGSIISGDFSEEVTFSLISEDGFTTQDWKIQVIGIETDFLTFDLEGMTFPAFIDDGRHEINVSISETVDITNLTPTFTLSPGATSNFPSGEAQDFSSPFTYVVTAEDGITIQNWVINVVQREVNDSNDFISFEFAEQTGPALIDLINHRVTVEVGFGSDITRLIPTFTLAAGATSVPASGVELDFSDTVRYTITSARGDEEIWEVVVSVAESVSSETDIRSFKLPGQIGEEVIDLENHKVAITMPIGTDRSNLTPTIELSFGASVSPESGEPRDFNFENTYTVTAQDFVTTQGWAVNAAFEDNSAPSDIILDNTKLLAVTGADQIVGKIQVVDANETDTHTVSIVPGSEFSLNGENLVTSRELNAGNYAVTIVVQDLAGAQISRNFTIEVAQIEVNESISIGTSISDYRIIGMPTDQVQVSDVLTNLDDAGQGTTWRILDYLIDGSYADFNSSSRFLAGKGYWILSENEVIVRFEQDPVTLDAEGNFNLTLRPGWNLISNPFIENLDWNQNILRNISDGNFSASDIQNGVIIYDGAYSSAATLGVFQGGWVNVIASTNINMSLQNPTSSQGSAGRRKTEEINEMRLTLSDGDRTTTLAGFAFHEQGSLQLDALDQNYPPAISKDEPFRLEGVSDIDFNVVPFSDSFLAKWQVLAPQSTDLYISWNLEEIAQFRSGLFLILNNQQVVPMDQIDQIKAKDGDLIEVLYGSNDPRVIVQVYPNPLQDELKLKILAFSASPVEEIQVIIYDLSGGIMIEKYFEGSEEIQISTDLLKDGLYIVKTWIGNGLVAEKKVMVQRD